MHPLEVLNQALEHATSQLLLPAASNALENATSQLLLPAASNTKQHLSLLQYLFHSKAAGVLIIGPICGASLAYLIYGLEQKLAPVNYLYFHLGGIILEAAGLLNINMRTTTGELLDFYQRIHGKTHLCFQNVDVPSQKFLSFIGIISTLSFYDPPDNQLIIIVESQLEADNFLLFLKKMSVYMPPFQFEEAKRLEFKKRSTEFKTHVLIGTGIKVERLLMRKKIPRDCTKGAFLLGWEGNNVKNSRLPRLNNCKKKLGHGCLYFFMSSREYNAVHYTHGNVPRIITPLLSENVTGATLPA